MQYYDGRHQHAYLGHLSCWALAAGGFGLLAGRKGRFLLICIVEKQYKTKVVTIDKDMFRIISKEFLQQYARSIEHTLY